MKITVVSAVFNAEATVAEAISSVAAQDYPNLEHVVVDGISTDGTLAAIETVAHHRMRLISERDDGIYDALNKGISLSTGDVVGFVHSDDTLADGTVLSRIASAFEDPEVEAVFGDLDYISRTDPGRIVRHWSTGPFAPDRLARGWMPAHPTLYLRRSVYDRIGGFDTSYGIAADYDFILRYFRQITRRTVYLPHVLYRMRMGGVSNRNLAKIRQKMCEDYRALRHNDVGGIGTLAFKNLSKLGQFAVRA